VDFSSTDLIAYPIDVVFSTHRDHLAQMVAYLPSVASIEVESRAEQDGVVRLVNLWTAKRTEVPRVLRPFVKPEMLRWIDRAAWFESEHVCRWTLELGFLKEAIRAEGENRMTSTADGHTAVEIAGQITVEGGRIPGVPSFLSRKVGKTVESFVVRMITPNLKKTNEGVSAFIAASRSAGEAR
jgi:hypothetical protein